MKSRPNTPSSSTIIPPYSLTSQSSGFSAGSAINSISPTSPCSRTRSPFLTSSPDEQKNGISDGYFYIRPEDSSFLVCCVIGTPHCPPGSVTPPHHVLWAHALADCFRPVAFGGRGRLMVGRCDPDASSEGSSSVNLLSQRRPAPVRYHRYASPGGDASPSSGTKTAPAFRYQRSSGTPSKLPRYGLGPPRQNLGRLDRR